MFTYPHFPRKLRKPNARLATNAGWRSAMCLLLGTALIGSAAEIEPVIISTRETKRAAIKLVQRADWAAVPVTLQSTQREGDQRLREVNLAFTTLQQALGKDGRMRLQFAQIEGGGSAYGKGSLALVPASAYSSGQSGIQLHLLVPISTGGNLMLAAAEAERLLTSVSFPKGLSIQTSAARLALSRPERFREQLLRLIADDTQRVAQLLGGEKKLTLQGLEHAIHASQVDDQNLELTIDYSLAIESQQKTP